MTIDARPGRTAAIEGFAAHLRAVRDAAGTPSYRVMAARSRAISHTTLHEAARGHRLPSWETVREYVRACDADPAPTRAAWEQAHAVVSASCGGDAPGPVPAPVPAVGEPSAGSAPEPGPVAVADPPPGRPLPRALVVGGTAAAVAVVAAVSSALASGSLWGGTSGSSLGRAAALEPSRTVLDPLPTPARCPVQQPNPPAAEPLHEGDVAVFVGDVTLPDCSVVERSRTVSKVWKLKNAGTRPWVGYRLQRVGAAVGPDDCQTITHVPVPDTAPGEVVEVGTAVTTPAAATYCIGRFKLTDADGALAFPGSRPVTYQLIVR